MKKVHTLMSHTLSKKIDDTLSEVGHLFRFNPTIDKLGLWIKPRGLGQGWTRPAGRAPGRPGNTSLCVASPE